MKIKSSETLTAKYSLFYFTFLFCYLVHDSMVGSLRMKILKFAPDSGAADSGAADSGAADSGAPDSVDVQFNENSF